MKEDQETHSGIAYLNEFHRKWNEACMEENRRVQSICFSAEFARAQSQSLDALVKREEERLRNERKKHKIKNNDEQP